MNPDKAQPVTSRMHFLTKRVILILFGILLALVILEIGLRLVHYQSSLFEYDPGTGLRILHPGASQNFIKPCFSNMVTSNQLGFHDVEFREEKPADVYRIAIVGDSFTQALEVPISSTFHNILEKRLNREISSSKKFQVYSFGMGGNGTLFNWLYFEKYAKRFKPDLVIDMFYDYNDITGSVGDKEIVDKFGYPDPVHLDEFIARIYHPTLIGKFFDWLAHHSLAAYFIRDQYNFLRIKFQSAALFPKALADRVPTPYFLASETGFDTALAMEKRIIGEFHDSVQKSGARFLLVSFDNVDFGINPKTDGFDQAVLKILDSSMSPQEHLALENDFYKKALQEKLLPSFSCDGHWDKIGHTWAAELIFDYLKSHQKYFLQTGSPAVNTAIEKASS